MTTQAGLVVCPDHEIPLHDGRCSRCEFEIPLTDLDRARQGLDRCRTAVRTSHPPHHVDVSLPRPEPTMRDRTEWAEGPGVDIAECERCGVEKPCMTINRHRTCRRCYVQPANVTDTRDPTREIP